MKCDRCKTNIEKGEERKLHGQILCEDCYMDAFLQHEPAIPGQSMPRSHFQKKSMNFRRRF